MAMALAHFSVGATIAILLVIAAREHTHVAVPAVILCGGIWAMGPDIHHIVPYNGLSDALYTFHSTPWADLFGFHYTIDTHFDPTDTTKFMGLCFALYCAATVVLSLLQFTDTRQS